LSRCRDEKTLPMMLRAMSSFWRVGLIAVVAFVVASRIPFIGWLLCWSIVIGAAFVSLNRLSATKRSPATSLGTGALVGAVVNSVGFLIAVIIAAIVVAAHPDAAPQNSLGPANAMLGPDDASGGNGVPVRALLFAPVWGAILGLLGGWLAIRSARSAATEQASPRRDD
jgi:hypothetical protein